MYVNQTDYDRVMSRRKQRQHRISPAIFHETPIAPMKNPHTGVSHHIIRLISQRRPGDFVDLLIRDTDLYLIAFRRSLDGTVGRWIRFAKENMPSFITECEVLKSDSGHDGKVTIGGPFTLIDIYENLVSLTKDEDTQVRALLRCCALFSEASRLTSVSQEMLLRMGDISFQAEPLGLLMEDIHAWSRISFYLLSCRERGQQHPYCQKLLQQLNYGCKVFSFDQALATVSLIHQPADCEVLIDPPMPYPENFQHNFDEELPNLPADPPADPEED